ncbi:MAG: RDD family protein [Mycobacterium sp.]|nr:RDD family protein [Mycobacterium sp.]
MNYTPWWARVVASLIDRFPPLFVVIVAGLLERSMQATKCLVDQADYSIGPYCATGNSVAGVLIWLAGLVIAVLFTVWNHGYLQGISGSSLGKRVLHFQVVDDETGLPIGFGRSVARQLAHLIDAITVFVGYLFPLWDPKRQTFADKIMSTVCVPAAR